MRRIPPRRPTWAMLAVSSLAVSSLTMLPVAWSQETSGEGDKLAEHYRALFADGPGIEVLKGARADDGRTCALEYTVVRVHGKPVPPQAGLAVYERGESGLLHAVRVYEDVEI